MMMRVLKSLKKHNKKIEKLICVDILERSVRVRNNIFFKLLDLNMDDDDHHIMIRADWKSVY